MKLNGNVSLTLTEYNRENGQLKNIFPKYWFSNRSLRWNYWEARIYY